MLNYFKQGRLESVEDIKFGSGKEMMAGLTVLAVTEMLEDPKADPQHWNITYVGVKPKERGEPWRIRKL